MKLFFLIRWPTLVIALLAVPASSSSGQRQMEQLGRGVVAVQRVDGAVLVSWRLLATDPSDIVFDVYRSAQGAAPVKL
ncbi:MAG: hypothetical protein JJ992_23560, partial [Planctomycetes bacterium]|nr:hypothetical protein [Planctomycetota bacterium]